MAIKLVNEESLVAVADALREVSGTSEKLLFPDGYIQAAKAGGGKSTRTINIDWSGDEEEICYVYYISDNQIKSVNTREADVIEAEGGVVWADVGEGYYSDNFIDFHGVYVATKDGGTIYPVSSGVQ